jgi:phosphatidylcholine synthase
LAVRKTIFGYLIHSITAFGAIAGLISLEQFINGNIRSGLLWLILCQLIDGFDGPIARKIDIHIHATRFDGRILDLVVDYVTCVMVPVAMLTRLKLLTSNHGFFFAALIIFTGALWFARTDQETEDHWFNGFPAAWNLVIPTYVILGTKENLLQISIVILSLLSLTKLKFPHLVKVKFMRQVTWTLGSIYFIALTWLSMEYPNGPSSLKPLLLLFPSYIFVISVYHSWNVRKLGVSSLNV